MTQAPAYPSRTALVSAEARSDYFESSAHYDAIARRIVAALRDDSRPLVLVTGDPPADPQALSEALGNVAGRRYALSIISCGPELRPEDLERPVPALAKPRATGGIAAEPGYSAPASPLLLFEDFDLLSDGQIEDIHEAKLLGGQAQRAAILLAPLDFLARLERPALRFLKDSIAAQFRFHEVGGDEAITVLHNQLLSQRNRRIEARGFRHGILVGLAAAGVVMAAGVGAFILHRTAEQVSEAPASAARNSLASEDASILRPAGEAVTSPMPEQVAPKTDTPSALTTAEPPPSGPPSPPTKVEDPPAAVPPAVVHPPAGPRLSATELTALLTRGDAFLSTGDITSARLFYERAAEADSGRAALQLGTTFDPMFTGRAALRGATADPAQALFWYRRARELGVAEAERRIESLETRPLGGPYTRSR